MSTLTPTLNINNVHSDWNHTTVDTLYFLRSYVCNELVFHQFAPMLVHIVVCSQLLTCQKTKDATKCQCKLIQFSKTAD